MKSINKTIVMIIVMLSITLSSSFAQITKVTLQASGLTCSMCNLAVKKSLQKLSFIKEIHADVETSIYTLTFKEGEKIILSDIQKAVKKAGFSVAKLVFTSTFNNMLIPENSQIVADGNTYHIIDNKNKKLNGSVDLRIIDKEFVLDKEYKKYKSKIIVNLEKQIFNVTIN